MPKLRHINKEKDFLEWARKRRNLKNQLAEKPAFPRCLACVGLCEVFATKALIPYQPPLGRFCGAFGKTGFFEPVWVIQTSETEMSYTNQLHLTSSMAHPKEWFLPENGGDTWGRK